MIKHWKHKGLRQFFETGDRSGIRPDHAVKLRKQLSRLNNAVCVQDMNVGWGLHSLSGDLAGHWSISVNGNWRITFRFENGDAILVNYQDYH